MKEFESNRQHIYGDFIIFPLIILEIILAIERVLPWDASHEVSRPKRL